MTRRLSIILNIILISLIGWYLLVNRDMTGFLQGHHHAREDFLEDIYYRARVDSFSALNAVSREARAVIAGDSIVAQFPMDELLAGTGALNRGVGMDTSNGVLQRLDRNVNNLRVGKFFLLVGHNDIKYRSVEEAAANISLIFSRVEAKEKYFISILPAAHPGQNSLIRELNERVRKASMSGAAFTYIDVYGKFLVNDGSIDKSLFYDGVHPNVDGYRLLAGSLEKYLR